MGAIRTLTEARDLWDQVCADDRIAFLSEPEAIEAQFRRLSALRSPSPKVWVDAYLPNLVRSLLSVGRIFLCSRRFHTFIAR